MIHRWLMSGLLYVVCAVLAGHVLACEARKLSVDEYQKSTKMALNLLQALEVHQPRLALISRVGSDLSVYGLTYSHIGFVRRDHPAGKWVVTHLLNHCKRATSSLHDEGLIPFFSDTPFRYQAQLLIPRPALQGEIESMLVNGKAQRLHEKRYSVIAHAERAKFQNSNQWVLEVLAVAKSLFLPGDQRVNALQLAKEQGYHAERIKPGLFKTLGAMLFSPNVRFADHDGTEEYPVVSVRSIVEFLTLNKDLIALEEIKLSGKRSIMSKVKPEKKFPVRQTNPIPNAPRSTADNSNETSFWQ